MMSALFFYILLIVTAQSGTPPESKHLDSPLSKSSSTSSTSSSSQQPVSSAAECQWIDIRNLITTITSTTSPSCYILSTMIRTKALQPMNPMTHKYFKHALEIHLNVPHINGLSVHFIPNRLWNGTEFELIIVFPDASLISDIWNFIHSKPLHGLYQCLTTPTIKRIVHVKSAESDTASSSSSAHRSLLSDDHHLYTENVATAAETDQVAGELYAVLQRLQQMNPIRTPPMEASSSQVQNEASNNNMNNHQRQRNSTFSDELLQRLQSASMSLPLGPRNFRRRSKILNNKGVSFMDSTDMSGYRLGHAEESASMDEFESAPPCDQDAESRRNSIPRSALPKIVTPKYKSMFGQRSTDCLNHIQWLFVCWVIIGMLLTTNLVTCIFACWAKKNAANLTNKAFSLAMSVRDKSKISTDTAVATIESSIKKRDSRDSISGLQQNQPQRQQLSVPIPMPRNQRNNTYHNVSPFNMALCSPIPSNYSKSYSYAPPIVNMQSVAPNPPLYAVPNYARSSPSDQQLMAAPFMFRQKNDIGKSAPSGQMFMNRRYRRSPSQLEDNNDDEKDDEASIPRSGSSNSSLMYGNDVAVPGTITTKSKLKDGESSNYSPSKRNISPSQ